MFLHAHRLELPLGPSAADSVVVEAPCDFDDELGPCRPQTELLSSYLEVAAPDGVGAWVGRVKQGQSSKASKLAVKNSGRSQKAAGSRSSQKLQQKAARAEEILGSDYCRQQQAPESHSYCSS